MPEIKTNIEVEEKYQPNEEQLKLLLEGSVFIGKKVNHDVYYDYSDCRLLKKSIKLRKRNGMFELKVKNKSKTKNEIVDKKEIEAYLNLDYDLEIFANSELEIIGEFETFRDEYEKDGFIIDVDKTSFDYEMCEIEVMVETEEQSEEIRLKIKEFARKYNFEEKKIKSKLSEYLRLFKPEIYKEIYENKLKEIKMK